VNKNVLPHKLKLRGKGRRRRDSAKKQRARDRRRRNAPKKRNKPDA